MDNCEINKKDYNAIIKKYKINKTVSQSKRLAYYFTEIQTKF